MPKKASKRKEHSKMSNVSKDFLGGGGGPKAVSLKNPGASVTGTICGEMSITQQTDPKDGSPKIWQDGSPMTQLIIPIQTNLHEDEEDDGMRRLFVASYSMRLAFKDALKAVGAEELEQGGTITTTYTRDGQPSNPALNPPKQYSVQYTPPSVSAQFLGNGANTVANAADTNEAAAVSLEGKPAGMPVDTWNSLPAAARAALANL
jgi:hypothetical protein